MTETRATNPCSAVALVRWAMLAQAPAQTAARPDYRNAHKPVNGNCEVVSWIDGCHCWLASSVINAFTLLRQVASRPDTATRHQPAIVVRRQTRDEEIRA